jgi:hypothetical protein
VLFRSRSGDEIAAFTGFAKVGFTGGCKHYAFDFDGLFKVKFLRRKKEIDVNEN